jgi:hypothetical protein
VPSMKQMPDGTYVYVDDSGNPTDQTGASSTPATGAASPNTNPYGGSAPPDVSGLQDAMTRFLGTGGQGNELDQYGVYDPAYEAAKASYANAQNQAGTDYTTQLQQLQNQITGQTAQLPLQQAQDQQNFQAQMALQGIGRSAGNLVGSSRIADQYQRMNDALANQLSGGTSALASQRANALTNAGNTFGAAKGDYAKNVSAQLLQQLQGYTDAQTKAQLAASIAAQYQPPNSPQQQAIQYSTPANAIGLTQPGPSQAAVLPQSQAPMQSAIGAADNSVDAILRKLGIS